MTNNSTLMSKVLIEEEFSAAKSCPTLFEPMDRNTPGSSVRGLFRQEYWSGLPPGKPVPSIHAHCFIVPLLCLKPLCYVMQHHTHNIIFMYYMTHIYYAIIYNLIYCVIMFITYLNYYNYIYYVPCIIE